MTERPIIFSGPMVRAILAGRKTQTRRIVKGIDECPHGYDGVVTGTVPKESHLLGKHSFQLASGESAYLRCPCGAPGDRLWVRETHAGDNLCGWVYRADHPTADIKAGDLDDGEQSLRHWVPSIHMKREACRLVLEVTKVRVERLGQISEKDARAEGIMRMPWPSSRGHGWAHDEGQPVSTTAVRAFEDLWHSIHGGWWPQTWVWVIEFKKRDR